MHPACLVKKVHNKIAAGIKFNVVLLTPEDGTDTLSRNVGGKKVPLLAV